MTTVVVKVRVIGRRLVEVTRTKRRCFLWWGGKDVVTTEMYSGGSTVWHSDVTGHMAGTDLSHDIVAAQHLVRFLRPLR